MAAVLQCAAWNSSLPFDFSLDSADDTMITSMLSLFDMSPHTGISPSKLSGDR